MSKQDICINRVEIEEGVNKTASNATVSKLGLLPDNFLGHYDYYKLPGSSVSNRQNDDGSATSTLSSRLLDISISNKGQEIVFGLKNNSPFWIAFEPESINYYISLNKNGHTVSYPVEYLDQISGMLFNYDRGAYELVVLPPNSQTEWTMYRINGAFNNGYDIISSIVKNKSIMDLRIPISIFTMDPLTSQLSRMKNKNVYIITEYTPVKSKISYRGGYFKEGNAYHIHNDYINLVRPKYSYDANRTNVDLKIVCDINIQQTQIPTKKTKTGLNVYAK